MSVNFDDSKRQVLPRWYPFETACTLGIIQSIRPRSRTKITSETEFNDKTIEWQEKKTFTSAVDLVGLAMIIGQASAVEAIDAAKFILREDKVSSRLSKEMASSIVHASSVKYKIEAETNLESSNIRCYIVRLKKRVRQFPRDSIAWADLSFFYALFGLEDKSEHCMDIAVLLAPDNRYILRSAARCYIHLNKPEKALYNLRRSTLSKIDPWVISAEVAISETIEEKSELIKAGRTLVGDTELTPWSINELAAALSTVEATHGSHRKSKKLILKALIEPSENTVAQAEWLSQRFGHEVVRPEKEIIALFEADARSSYKAGEFKKSLEYAKRWFNFQPFSSRPAEMASYIALTCLRDENEALRIIESAEIHLADSFVLKNNKAFSLASLNRVEEAEVVLEQINRNDLDESETYVNFATNGLLQFRMKDPESGRALYEKAILGFKKLKQSGSVAMAKLFWAREEMIVQDKRGRILLNEVAEIANKFGIKEIISYINVLESEGEKT